jgi:DNA replication protein DnaC
VWLRVAAVDEMLLKEWQKIAHKVVVDRRSADRTSAPRSAVATDEPSTPASESARRQGAVPQDEQRRLGNAPLEATISPQADEKCRRSFLRSLESRRHVAVSTETGKTYIALGIGLAAGVFYAKALVHELPETCDEMRFLRLQWQVAGYTLLIIEELGYVPLSQIGAELLFENIETTLRARVGIFRPSDRSGGRILE